MFLAFGILAALWERERSGQGQVVDAAIVDGVSHLMTMFTGLLPSGHLSLDRARNMLGGSAPFYRTYRCADDREVAVGAIEPAFWSQMLEMLGLVDTAISQREEDWPATVALLERTFAAAPSTHWIALFRDTDTCVSSVLSAEEAYRDDHLVARGTFIDYQNLLQAAPAPRLSRTPARLETSQCGAQAVESGSAR